MGQSPQIRPKFKGIGRKIRAIGRKMGAIDRKNRAINIKFEGAEKRTVLRGRVKEGVFGQTKRGGGGVKKGGGRAIKKPPRRGRKKGGGTPRKRRPRRREKRGGRGVYKLQSTAEIMFPPTSCIEHNQAEKNLAVQLRREARPRKSRGRPLGGRG